MVTRVDVYAWGGFVLLVLGAEQISRTASLLMAGGCLLVFAGLEIYLRMRGDPS